MRRRIIAGNWKMNMLPNEAINFIQELEPLVKDIKDEIIICVPYINIFYSMLTAQGTNIKIGAQNVHWEEKGAYTGEISPKMLKSIGIEYVIIGHSERRQYFAETDETVNKKIKAALSNNLKPIICVGENQDEKEKGVTFDVLTKQINFALEGIKEEQIENCMIAYEPIWAIGTGKTATKEEANSAIKHIRDEISKKYGQNVANSVIILYGGSVNSANAKELFNMPDIDGGLIGGASLNTKDFFNIINA